MHSTRTPCLVAVLALVLIAALSGVAAGDDCRTYVVDRIDAGDAVLLVEDADRTVDQRTVPVDDLPAAARHEGAVLERVDGGYVYDEATTERRLSRADDFDRLSTALDGDGGDHAGADGQREDDRSHHHASAGDPDGRAGTDRGGDDGGWFVDLCRLRLGSFSPFGACGER